MKLQQGLRVHSFHSTECSSSPGCQEEPYASVCSGENCDEFDECDNVTNKYECVAKDTCGWAETSCALCDSLQTSEACDSSLGCFWNGDTNSCDGMHVSPSHSVLWNQVYLACNLEWISYFALCRMQRKWLHQMQYTRDLWAVCQWTWPKRGGQLYWMQPIDRDWVC